MTNSQNIQRDTQWAKSTGESAANFHHNGMAAERVKNYVERNWPCSEGGLSFDRFKSIARAAYSRRMAAISHCVGYVVLSNSMVKADRFDDCCNVNAEARYMSDCLSGNTWQAVERV